MYKKYEAMRNAGGSPHEVYRAALEGGMKTIGSLKLIMQVFGLSLVEAKEVSIVELGYAKSLDEYQGHLVEALQKALDELPSDEDDSPS